MNRMMELAGWAICGESNIITVEPRYNASFVRKISGYN